MLTIGLLGGMSWESSAHYYRLLNERVRERLEQHGLTVLVPDEVDRQLIHRVIFSESCVDSALDAAFAVSAVGP
jgi:aspartate/glutamate racemase